jgi:hypothetical protein
MKRKQHNTTQHKIRQSQGGQHHAQRKRKQQIPSPFCFFGGSAGELVPVSEETFFREKITE